MPMTLPAGNLAGCIATPRWQGKLRATPPHTLSTLYRLGLAVTAFRAGALDTEAGRGERYPVLVRDGSKPDLLESILKSITPAP